MADENVTNAIDAVVGQDMLRFKEYVSDTLRTRATAEVEDRVGDIQNTAFSTQQEEPTSELDDETIEAEVDDNTPEEEEDNG